ncbi:hypothetical protein NKI61_08370 [Mesorhizobium sp. M0514]|uniref:hypothetical protein n=1 Tax=Mesorhizobium sp. M0514 TaxID=2956955 RepID=UPI003339C062
MSNIAPAHQDRPMKWRATGLDAQLRGHLLRGRRCPVNAAGDRQQMSFRRKKFGVAAIGHSALEQGSHGDERDLAVTRSQTSEASVGAS